MTIAPPLQLLSRGIALDTAPEHFGELLDSNDIVDDVAALKQRMARDGYLFLPGLLHRDEVLDARREMTRRLAESGQFKPGTDPMDAIVNPDLPPNGFQPELAKDNAPLHKVVYDGPLMAFFERFLGGPVRHFDFTWIRTRTPGPGTESHVDSVYMNRGTQNLFTTWVPIGDVDYTLGGLMILEGSNNNQRLKETYGKQDVDTFCENKPDAKKWGKSWGTSGALMGNPNQIRNSVVGENGRWLTAEYRAGDALIFSIHTIHASLDNRTADRFRFSTDTRYQLASEPVDERWIGENPIAHGAAGKRGKIC